jgi:hypothetical protein
MAEQMNDAEQQVETDSAVVALLDQMRYDVQGARDYSADFRQQAVDSLEVALDQIRMDIKEARDSAKILLQIKKVISLVAALVVVVIGLVFAIWGSNRDRELVLIATSSLGALGVFLEGIAKLEDSGKKVANLTAASNLLEKDDDSEVSWFRLHLNVFVRFQY